MDIHTSANGKLGACWDCGTACREAIYGWVLRKDPEVKVAGTTGSRRIQQGKRKYLFSPFGRFMAEVLLWLEYVSPNSCIGNETESQ